MTRTILSFSSGTTALTAEDGVELTPFADNQAMVSRLKIFNEGETDGFYTYDGADYHRLPAGAVTIDDELFVPIALVRVKAIGAALSGIFVSAFCPGEEESI